MITMNFSSFGFDGFEMLPWRIEVKLGNEIIKNSSMQMPKEMMQMQFFGLCEQIAYDDRPMKATLYGEKWIDYPNGKSEKFPSSLSFLNNAYLANFEDERGE